LITLTRHPFSWIIEQLQKTQETINENTKDGVKSHLISEMKLVAVRVISMSLMNSP
jgi:hypothetical protein